MNSTRLLFVLLGFFLFALSKNAFGQAASVLPAATFQKKVAAAPDAQLIDVRTPAEYAGGKLPGSRLASINNPNFRAEMEKLDKQKPVFVYCAVGGRSRNAANILIQMGFREVYDLQGGIQAWQRAGLQVVK